MKCPKCNTVMEIKDGKEVGGMPNIRYHSCPACGYARAIVKKQPKPHR